ncbi:MAG: FAD-binding domain-containing protein [Campylobacterota bacterium]
MQHAKTKLYIVVFRNNLRVTDNAPLYEAAKDNIPLLALYPHHIINTKNRFQTNFIYEALINLQHNLQKLGIHLAVVDNLQETLMQLSQKFLITVFFAKEVGIYEKRLEKDLAQFCHKSYYNQTMIEPFTFDYTKSFSHFRKKAEKLDITPPLPMPQNCTTIDYPSRTIKPLLQHADFRGGEDAALKQVAYYSDFFHSYKARRDQVDGFDNSCKFSPYLSIGCISARTIYSSIKEYEAKTHRSKSSYWIYFELLWRDFFHLVMDGSDNRLFLSSGLKKTRFDYFRDEERIDRFFEAQNGVAIIDAALRQLHATGWLSNRNRQLVASYFIKNLGFNWICLAKHFQDHLIDYNPANNYGNFAYQAYVGNDSRYRVFDITKQAKIYGGDLYIKKWLGHTETTPQHVLDTMAQKVAQEVYEVANF